MVVKLYNQIIFMLLFDKMQQTRSTCCVMHEWQFSILGLYKHHDHAPYKFTIEFAYLN